MSMKSPTLGVKSANANWLLPEGVDEILPQQALHLEHLRRHVLDELMARQFQLVMPPVMEFVDALLTGTGAELDTQTYKFMDQHSHRMLGVRADMTPQIARIDAHYLSDNEVNRLCYAGTVLRTKPSYMGGPREQFQIGAELFGVDELSADVEIINAMLNSLKICGIEQLTISFGHVGLYNGLLAMQTLSNDLQIQLADSFMRKSLPDLEALQKSHLETDLSCFQQLMALQGGLDVLNKAKQQLPQTDEIRQAIAWLEAVVDNCRSEHPEVDIHIDLADVAGRDYHTGLKFTAFVANEGRSIARGGRYNHIGEKFGRARPATGFSMDLKSLIQLSSN